MPWRLAPLPVAMTASWTPPRGWLISRTEEFQPDLAAHAVYDQIYAEYRRLHDYFGRENDVMKHLKSIRAGVLSS